jgi:hypothetical protein
VIDATILLRSGSCRVGYRVYPPPEFLVFSFTGLFTQPERTFFLRNPMSGDEESLETMVISVVEGKIGKSEVALFFQKNSRAGDQFGPGKP